MPRDGFKTIRINKDDHNTFLNWPSEWQIQSLPNGVQEIVFLASDEENKLCLGIYTKELDEPSNIGQVFEETKADASFANVSMFTNQKGTSLIYAEAADGKSMNLICYNEGAIIITVKITAMDNQETVVDNQYAKDLIMLLTDGIYHH